MINEMFGMNFQIEQMDKIKGLPIYMTVGRSFYKATNDDISMLIVSLSDNEKYGVVAFAKQKELYEKVVKLPTVYYFNNITQRQRDSLISHRISFVAGNKQMYLPFLGMYLQNLFSKNKDKKIEKIMPVTQSLFLYFLYESKGRKVQKKDAADFLRVTRTSITRASEQLASLGLIKQEKSGKEYYMWTELNGFELFKRAKPYLINPVYDSYTTMASVNNRTMPLSGESALSSYSMINPPPISCIAASKSIADEKSFVKIDKRWEDEDELVTIEFWKYDPCLFEKEGKVDPVSLYMSMNSSVDERIESALEEMMEGYEW